MSKFTEYIKLIPKGIPHSKEVLESILTNVQMKMGNLPEDQKAEIIRRRLICMSCPFMSENAKTSKEYKELTGRNYKTARNDFHCSFCGCEMNMRTRALNSECGLNTWNADHPQKIIPLKWTKFEENES